MIESAWKCSTTDSNDDSERYSWRRYLRRYLLDDGCLHKSTRYSSLNSKAFRLCIAYPINGVPLYEKSNVIRYTYRSRINQKLYECPMNWIDLNKHCYRISGTSKTIQEARNSCIAVSQSELNEEDEDVIIPIDDYDDDYLYSSSTSMSKDRADYIKDYTSELHKGEVVQYSSQWQSRFGFFLLDTSKVFHRYSTNSYSTVVFHRLGYTIIYNLIG